MGSLRFVEWMILAIAASTALLAVITLGLKGLRAVTQAIHERYRRRLEPALEGCLISGEDCPELARLRLWERDRFLTPLMVERMALLRGSERDCLARLAADLGLVDHYLGKLRSRRRWVRARAAQNLGYFGGEKAVASLSGLLADKDETVRAVTARALARIGTKSAAETLARTLNDPSELTRLRVAENLERLGDLVVEPLSGLILTLAARGAVMAVRVLGNLRAAKARPALIGALLYTRDEDVRAQATLALGKIGNPDDIPFIIQGARNRSWPVRVQTANALGLIGEVSAIPTLVELATDEKWWVRKNSCQALANMGPSGEKALIEILEGDDRYARDRAAAALELQGVTRRMVRRLAKDGQGGERARSMVTSIAKAGSVRYLRSLAETLPEGEEIRFLRSLLEETDEL